MSRLFYKRVRKRGDGQENPFWISYADLMTALVMLFLVVMSISMVAIAIQTLKEREARAADDEEIQLLSEQTKALSEQTKQEREAWRKEKEAWEKARNAEKVARDDGIEKILESLVSTAKAAKLDLKVNAANHTISFGEDARFAFNSFILTKAARRKLQAFVPVLLHVQNTRLGKQWLKRVHIEGYTDPRGTYLYNVNLSLNRAHAVVCVLFGADLSQAQQRELRQLLTIDGATVTSIKESPDESRRVEVRLEFRQLDDESVNPPVPEMKVGICTISLE